MSKKKGTRQLLALDLRLFFFFKGFFLQRVGLYDILLAMLNESQDRIPNSEASSC